MPSVLNGASIVGVGSTKKRWARIPLEYANKEEIDSRESVF
jgi:hypothetical protein